jgi:LuxR family transcriptional regulator, maltose regulon positive regulatory protein
MSCADPCLLTGSQSAARSVDLAARSVDLTERQVRVLRLLRGSLTLTEIATELSLSPNTVKTHTQAIYRKLGVCTREEAVTRGLDEGILRPPIRNR